MVINISIHDLVERHLCPSDVLSKVFVKYQYS